MGLKEEEDKWDRANQEILRTFPSGATRGSNKNKYDYEGFINPAVLRRYAEYMHAHRLQTDGTVRDSDNWQKGMPKDEYIKSLLRHTMDAWLLHRGEEVYDPETGRRVIMIEALCGIMFNAMGMMLNIIKGRI